MKVDVSKIVSAIGEPLAKTKTVQAYKYLAAGEELRAGRLLSKMHYEAYWTGIRNKTTDAIVARIYKERGLKKPFFHNDSAPDIVREAVARRVQNEMDTVKDMIANGMRVPPKVIAYNDVYMLRDGYNRVCLMIALGKTEIDVEG